MSITEKKPPYIETVGAQYVCFNSMDDNGQWNKTFETDVERTKTVKTVTVTENSEVKEIRASGELYDSDTIVASVGIDVEAIAFPSDTLAKMRGDNVSTKGLIHKGGNRSRPFFAYGKVVKLSGGEYRYDWFPKCKLTSNSDESKTSEKSFSEQTEKVTITAYPFNDDGDIVSSIDSTVKVPDGMTEDKFFAKPVLTDADLV